MCLLLVSMFEYWFMFSSVVFIVGTCLFCLVGCFACCWMLFRLTSYVLVGLLFGYVCCWC